MGIGVVSCRQDDELNTQNGSTDLSEMKTAGDDENNNSAKTDSTKTGLTPNDPPKNGTHWKTGDSLNLFNEVKDPPKIESQLKIDSTAITIIDDDIKDPPKNGTHWKSSGK